MCILSVFVRGYGSNGISIAHSLPWYGLSTPLIVRAFFGLLRCSQSAHTSLSVSDTAFEVPQGFHPEVCAYSSVHVVGRRSGKGEESRWRSRWKRHPDSSSFSRAPPARSFVRMPTADMPCGRAACWDGGSRCVEFRRCRVDLLLT